MQGECQEADQDARTEQQAQNPSVVLLCCWSEKVHAMGLCDIMTIPDRRVVHMSIAKSGIPSGLCVRTKHCTSISVGAQSVQCAQCFIY